jgi:hypothetical protein
MENYCICNKARLNTISAQHSGAWLQAIPNPSLGLAMLPEEFVVALCAWLGIPLFSSFLARLCFCGHALDVYGDNLLGCGHSNL